MDSHVARRAHAILMEAIEKSPAERAAFVTSACLGDPLLRTRVRELLDALDRSSGFLETPALAARSSTAAGPAGQPIEKIGQYRIVRAIGFGGMATVYEAVQEQPRRSVALKVMRHALANTSAFHRFQYEMETLARLQHPGVAQIFEAGMWSPGDGASIPFFAMEYVSDARTVIEYARVRGLSLMDRLRLFAKICDAVQHGHQHGVIHRDLKPGNILVDAAGQPKVIDFGIARSSDPAQAWITQQVDLGQLIGTLNYMSPEQCAGRDIDTRTDVYSLGVVLYELACDRLPEDLSGVPLGEALRIVRERAVPRPAAVNPELRGDVEAIILKAIEKDPDRRYHTVEALGADIRRYLNHQTITARPPTLFYQCRLFARRNRALVLSASAVGLAIIAASVLTATFAYRATQESQQRLKAENSALQQRDAALWNSYVANIAAAMAAHRTGEIQQVSTRLELAPEHLRGWEWRFLAGNAQRSMETLAAHDDRVFDLAITPDRSRLASAGRDGLVRVWNAADRSLVKTLTMPERSPAYAVALSADGERAASGSEDGIVRVWELHTARIIRSFDTRRRRVWRVALGSRELLAAASYGGSAHVWDLASGALIRALEDQPGGIHGLLFSSDGSRLVTWNRRGAVWLRSADGADVLQRLSFGGAVECAAITPDGTLLAAGGARGRVTVWDLRSGETVHEAAAPGSLSPVRSLSFSASGEWLAAGRIDRQIQVISLRDNRHELLRGHDEAVSGLHFSANGHMLFSASWDGTIRVWGFTAASRTDYIRQFSGHRQDVLAVAFSPDSQIVASGSADRTIRLRNPVLGSSLGTLRGHKSTVSSIAFSPDGLMIASGSYDRSIRLWSASSGRCMATLNGHTGSVWSVAFSPDGSRLVSGGDDAAVRVWDLTARKDVLALGGHAQRVTSVSYSPDGRLVASGSRDSTVSVWNAETGALIRRLADHTSDVFAVAFSSDGRLLYSGSRDQTVRVWSLDTGRCLGVLAGHGQFVTSLALSPDGTRLAAGSWFGQVVLWDLARREFVASLQADPNAIRAVSFSPDGRWLATGGDSRVVRLFDAAPPAERLKLQAAAVEQSRAARRLLAEARGNGGTVDHLELDARITPEVRRWLQILSIKDALADERPDSDSP